MAMLMVSDDGENDDVEDKDDAYDRIFDDSKIG